MKNSKRDMNAKRNRSGSEIDALNGLKNLKKKTTNLDTITVYRVKN